MNPELKEMTEALGMMVQIGGMSQHEIIAWIVDLIEKTENPPEWMIELSLSKGRHILDVVHLLHDVPGVSNPDTAFRLLLNLLEEKYPNLKIEDENIARNLCFLVHSSVPKEFENLLYQLDGDLDMIHEGYGNWTVIQEDYRELLDSRNSHAQPEKCT